MRLKGIQSFGTDWPKAEQFCDEWAGDNQAHAAVVENFATHQLLVMDIEDATRYVQFHDAEIQYDTNYTAQ